eukprot:m.58449 g.58449  ORF g.58449 m.58449 type:complete len:63 (-) comp19006_c0_seq1:222-410(-)
MHFSRKQKCEPSVCVLKHQDPNFSPLRIRYRSDPRVKHRNNILNSNNAFASNTNNNDDKVRT